MIGIEQEDRMSHSRIELLRKKLDNEAYLNEAIQRIALVLCNEFLDISQEGGVIHGRQWKRRK
ncbi:MAG: hypothetical protein LBE17_01235 [Treponema sp.]|jgi:hypothetical protein|nr:hypothetical protein [Treponema sp.]